MRTTLLSAFFLLSSSLMSAAQEPFPVRVLTHREQAALQREWIETRFDTLLPDLMRRSGIDMWLIVSREYDDDPVFRSMAPVTTYSSRRRTILVFIDRGGTLGVERLSIGRFDYDGLYTLVKTHNDGQWEGLRQLVEQRDPATIGINTSELFSHADGLSSSEKSALIEALGAKYAARLRSAEALAVGWLEVKLRGETEAYRLAVRIAHEIIAEAFSSRVIAPGVSTTGDVVWWMRQRVASLGLGQWFQPSVTIWRQGGVAQPPPPEGHVIERGDFLHCDFGIVYLGFSTDTQQNAYVLRTGETDAPAGLRAGLRDAGRLQDITMQCARAGVSGNAALSCALAQARREGLAPSIYCHPIGYHGHGAGPPIGMTDYQDGVPGRGEYLLRAATWHSIELNVTHAVPEWGNEQIRVALEEDAALLDEGWSWIDGRQTALHLIR